MTDQNSVSKGARIGGWILTLLPALMMLFAGASKLHPTPDMMKQMEKSGMTADVAFKIGIVELACTIIYLIPRTSVLGAILLTGFLGGATFANVEHAPPMTPIVVVLGVLFWGGLFLRDRRIRALIPLRS